MKKCIEASHERCRKRGFLPENIFSTRILEGEDLAKRLEQNKTLINTAAQFLRH